jgi:hypothetical protein
MDGYKGPQGFFVVATGQVEGCKVSCSHSPIKHDDITETVAAAISSIIFA